MCQPVTLCIASLQKSIDFLTGQGRVVYYGFQISLYAAYRGFQFVGNVLCQLFFKKWLYTEVGCYKDVEVTGIDGDFKAVILKDNALHGKDTSVFVYV